MRVPTVEDFEKLSDEQAHAYLLKVTEAYNQARMSRFIKRYCLKYSLSKHTYDNLMHMSNIQPRTEHVCQATVNYTGAMCGRCARREYGNVFCGYHKSEYEKYKKKQTVKTRRAPVVRKNKKGKELKM